MTAQSYLNHFSVSREMLQRLISAALAKGGDYADLYFEHTSYNDMTFRDGEVNSMNSNIDYGMGVRVLKGEKTGYAYTESTDFEEMSRAASSAAMIADIPCSFKPDYASHPIVQGQSRYSETRPILQGRASDKLPYLKALGEKILAADSRVTKVIARIADSTSRIMMYNSLGELTFDSRPLLSVTATVIFKGKDGKAENKSVSRSFRMGLEMLTDSLIAEIASQAVKGIDQRLAAIRPKGGEMPVVMGAGGSGILLHEAIGHAFEADFIRKRQSIFSEQLGKQVCHPSINIVDDGTIFSNRGAVSVDDEGVPGQKTYMVREGRVNSFLHDRISAAHFNVPPTGNGRRESFRYQPIPRMRCTYMESAEGTLDGLISQVRQGIYVDDFSNGQVKIGEGDFTFYVKNGFLIEGGKLTAPVKDINIIGNGPKALSDIVAVASDLVIDNGTWTCGKGQSCPVSCGIPSILVKSLTVGGEA